MAYRLIVLFRNDLRLHDNVLLDTAARRVRQHRANEVGRCDPGWRREGLVRLGAAVVLL